MAAGLHASPAFSRTLYGFAGRTLAFQSDDAATLHLLEAAYGALAGRAARGVQHTAVVRRSADGRLHAQFDRQIVDIGEAPGTDPLLASYYGVREIFARLAASVPDTVAFYGALVGVNRRGVLLLGPAGCGKTLLALHLAAQGATFLGEETAILNTRSTTARALPRRPSLRDSALPLLPRELRACVANNALRMQTPRGTLWYALDETALPGISSSASEYELSAIAFLASRSARASVQPIDGDRAIAQLLQRSYARPYQLRELSALKRASRRVMFFDVAVAQPEATASMILEAVRSCG